MYRENSSYYHDYLAHHGVKGMKWGVRRFQNKNGSLTSAGKKRARTQYRSTSVRSAMARRSNDKVDKSFKNWNDNSQKKTNAIDLGKQRNADRMAYERDKSDKDLKTAYKQSNKAYKKALRDNTTYRKGVVKQEVGRDAARKYLNEAKRVEKQLKNDPSNKQLKKQYTKLMNKHDIERADARRAVAVASKRSAKKAAIKRSMTMTVKATATTAAVTVGLAAVNKYALNGQLDMSPQQVIRYAKKAKDLIGYMY